MEALTLMQVTMCLLSAEDTDLSLWLWLGAAAVLATAGFYFWQLSRRAGRAAVTAEPPASDPPPAALGGRIIGPA
jgi:hypothetical protein